MPRKTKQKGWLSTGMAISVALGAALLTAGAVLWPWVSVGLLTLPGKIAIPQSDLGGSTAALATAASAPLVSSVQVPVAVPRAWEKQPQPVFTKEPSPQCTTPPASTDHVQVRRQCMACYRESMKALAGGTGSDIVIGANNGKRYDPADFVNYWEDVPQHTKVFVEPIPPIFAELKENMKALPNFLPLNVAVRVPSGPLELALFCWDLDIVNDAVKNGATPLPPEVRQPKEHWAFICGLEKEKVLDSANVFWTETYSSLPPKRKLEVRAQVEKFIVRWNVQSLTPKEIIDKAGPSDVRYVQIDVEGLDNQVVRALPFGQAGFWPEVVLYEDNNGAVVRHVFEDQGYFTCCCVDKFGSNILAVRNHPGAKGAL